MVQRHGDCLQGGGTRRYKYVTRHTPAFVTPHLHTSPAIRLLFTVLSNRENGMGHAVTANFQQIAIFYCFGRFIQILNSMRLISSVVDRRYLDVQS